MRFFPHLSVEDNIGFGLARKRAPRAQARQRVAEVIVPVSAA